MTRQERITLLAELSEIMLRIQGLQRPLDPTVESINATTGYVTAGEDGRYRCPAMVMVVTGNRTIRAVRDGVTDAIAKIGAEIRAVERGGPAGSCAACHAGPGEEHAATCRTRSA